MADYVAARSAAKVVVGAGSTRAVKSLKDNYVGLLMGFTLSVNLSWTKAGGFKLTVKLEKTDRFDIGESFRDDLLNVRLENVQQIFSIEV